MRLLWGVIFGVLRFRGLRSELHPRGRLAVLCCQDLGIRELVPWIYERTLRGTS